MLKIGSHQVPTRTLLLVGVDVGTIVAALLLTFAVRFRLTAAHEYLDEGVWAKIGLVTVVCWLALYFSDLYDFNAVRRRATLLVHVMQALGAGCVILSLAYFLVPAASLGRGVALIAVPVIFTMLMTWRLSANMTDLLASGSERVLVMGTGEAGITLVRHILEHPEYNIKVVGFLDEKGQDIGKSLVNPRILGATADVEAIVAHEQVDHVVLALKERRGGTPIRELLSLKFAGVRIEDVHSTFERLTGRISLAHISPSWFILADGFKKSNVLLAAKRFIDMAVAAVILLVVSPLLPLIALAIMIESGRPIFFRQTRVGYKGKEFNLLKFRSMVKDAEKHGPQFASQGDSRVTRVGRFMRKTRLDELPQLFNVFRGEMSLVGPRPERPYFVAQLEEKIPFYSLRHSVRPGLTGWAQVRFRYTSNLDDTKDKLELDLFYLKNLSLTVDMAILFETAKVVLLGRGAQ